MCVCMYIYLPETTEESASRRGVRRDGEAREGAQARGEGRERRAGDALFEEKQVRVNPI